MKWRFSLPGKKRGGSVRDEAGPSSPVVPARRSASGPSSARPPRPSSVAADAITGVQPNPHPNLSSSVASAHSSGRFSGMSIPTTSAEASSAPEPVQRPDQTEPRDIPMEAGPAVPNPVVAVEPYVPQAEDNMAIVPVEPYIAPNAVPALSDSFHWSYQIPVLTPEQSCETNAAHISDGVMEQFFGAEYLNYLGQNSDGHTTSPQTMRAALDETVMGNPQAFDYTPAQYYDGGYYPMDQTAYQTEPAYHSLFDTNGVCTACACYGGHYPWCAYRHVPLPLPTDYRCNHCGQGTHLENACPTLLNVNEVTQAGLKTQPTSPRQTTPPVEEPSVPNQPRDQREDKPTPPTSTDSGQQLRGSHCPLCGAHKKHWYRNLVCK